MKTIDLRVMLVACAIASATFATPTLAASPITNAFMANVEKNVDFIAKSSKLALARTSSAHVRDFAQDSAAAAAATADALDQLTPSGQAAATPRDSEALMTGRSVAVDGVTPVAGQSANGRAPLGAEDLAALAKLQGRQFDRAFRQKQLDALNQLRADYQSYSDDGDDAVLAAMAEGELPNIDQRLGRLSRL